jgi:3-methyl-2-oxobutanoate hydroxymethyltransferase
MIFMLICYSWCESLLVVVDIAFGSYQSNSDIALASAIRIMKETGDIV